MSIPSSGAISISQISTDNADGYGLGYALGSYRGQLYDNKAGGVGAFSNNAIALGDFYGKRRVDAGSSSYGPGSYTYVVPPYVTMTVQVYGAGGGGQGGFATGSGGCDPSQPGGGNNGGATTLSGIVSAPGGASGGNGGAGYGYVGGGGGGGNEGGASNGKDGGSGGYATVTFTNPALGGTGPASGSSISLTVGAGGDGGGGAQSAYLAYNGFTYYCTGGSYANPGGGGGGGSAIFTWTGD